MVGKDGELGDIDERLAQAKLIFEKKKQLEQTADQVRQEISSCFERLMDALRGRERQLLRQVEAVHRQQVALVQSNSDLLPANANLGVDLGSEADLLTQLLNFGRIDLSNSIVVKDFEPYRAEEYQEAGEDVVSFDKSLKSEADEFDVSSVMRRKRDSHGNISNKPVVINFNCTSCDVTVKSPDNGNDVPVVASTSRQFDENQGVAASSSSRCADSPFVDNESDSEDSSAEDEMQEKPMTQSENSSCLLLENTDDEETKVTSSSTIMETLAHSESDNVNVTSSTEDDNATGVDTQEKSKDGLAEEHPIQIQQWLRQILAETETEPIVNEIGRPIVSQFPKIPNTTRLYREFPVET